MRTRTPVAALALVASIAAVAFTPSFSPFSTQDVRAHGQKEAGIASGQILDPRLIASSGAKDCVDATPSNGVADAMAGQFPCAGVDLLSYTHVNAFGSTKSATGSTGVSDVWGWTAADGSEYVIAGKTTGVAFMNVTDPTKPILLGNLDSPVAADLIWFDIKVVNDFAYIVSESAGHGLLVFDLKQLVGAPSAPAKAWQPTSVYPLTGSAHNIVANEEAEMVYVVGGNNGLAVEDICRASLHMIDVSNPSVPVFAGCYLDEGGYGVAGGLAPAGPARTVARQLSRYVHDAQCVRYAGPDTAHTGKDICITSAEDHVSVVDVTNPLLPVKLGTVTYDKPAYTHQGWLSPDQTVFYVGDELDEEVQPGKLPTRTMVLDVADLDAPKVSFIHEAALNTIDHNMYTRADALFQSNYTAGLRILDTSRVKDKVLTEAAYFDVRPTDNATIYAGTWSNYPYFESGTVVITGYDGVWLVRVQDEVATRLGLR